MLDVHVVVDVSKYPEKLIDMELFVDRTTRVYSTITGRKQGTRKQGGSPRATWGGAIHFVLRQRQSRQLALRTAPKIHAAEIAVYIVTMLGFPLSDISHPSPPNGTIPRHLHLVGEYSAKDYYPSPQFDEAIKHKRRRGKPRVIQHCQ